MDLNSNNLIATFGNEQVGRCVGQGFKISLIYHPHFLQVAVHTVRTSRDN
jgi:hypothetical protein